MYVCKCLPLYSLTYGAVIMSLLPAHLFIIFGGEVSVSLEEFMEPGFNTLLTAAQRVTVTVQQAVHVGAFYHLDQDGGQLPFKG